MSFLGTGLLSGKKSIGARLGEDLGSALKGLAQHKVQQKQAQELEKVGIPKPLANIFHTLDPKVQQDIWKQVNLQNIGQNEQPQMQQSQQQIQPQEPSFTPEQTNFIKSLQSPLDRKIAAQQFQQQNQQPMQLTPNEQIGNAAAQQNVAQQLSPENKNVFNGPENKLKDQMALEEFKQQRKAAYDIEKQEREKYEKGVEKSTDWLLENNKKTRALEKNEARLDVMKKAALSGKLDDPGFSAGLDTLAHGLWGFGINLKHLQNPDTQAFEKLSNDMLNGIQDVFGSRILKTEVDTFMKTIPNLMQSDEGKVMVINNLKLLNEADIAVNKTAKEIIRENGGKVPPDLQFQVDYKMDEYLNDWADRFKNQIHEKPVNNKSFTKNAGTLFKAGFKSAFGKY